MRKLTCLLLTILVVVCFAAGCGQVQEEPADTSGATQQEVYTPEGAVNIKDMGAAGDGIADDTNSIQQAIDSVTADNAGGIVYIPAGTYLVKTWVFLKSNLTILMDENAVILNGINESSGASIVFMCGPYEGKNKTFEWDGIENVVIEGGTIDMNGELNASQTAPKNLPAVSSSTGAIALGYARNFTIRNVTFRDSYNGHALQICNSESVLVEDCRFIGQSLPGSGTDSENSQKEYIQIEPSSTAGFPYATNETYKPSQNITIRNCYFGASDKCGEPMVAIGTHSQKPIFEKCNNIVIESNIFDNVAYGAVRFAGYEDVIISGNTFIKQAKHKSTNFRNGTCVLINIFCVNNTTDELDLNKRITINDNIFEIDDPDTRAIRVGKDKAEYKGEVSDVVITNNKFTNTSDTDSQMIVSAIRVKNLTVSGNSLNGGWRGFYIDRCYGDITVQDNDAADLTAENCYIRYTGGNEMLSFYSSGNGMVEVRTEDGKYAFTAVASANAEFDGFYSNASGSGLITKEQTVSYFMSHASKVEAYAVFH